MKKVSILILLAILLAQSPIISQNQIVVQTQQPNPEIEQTRKIQIVFCLDATGSMGGLISAAKQKIWSISSTLLQADPKPELEIGMVFYRDRGDQFVTKRIALTQNLDSVYDGLMDIVATGGGDSPESVNQALDEAVNLFAWSQDTSVYKAIFLVGDCPPHMDYQDDVKYPVTCRKAVQKDIVINALQMGNCNGAKAIWTQVALIAGGDYISVDQKANGYVVTTPCDEELARLQNEIDNTVVYYGVKKIRVEKQKDISRANKIYKNGKASESASRAEYKMTKGIKTDHYFKQDLVKDVAIGKVKLDTLSEQYLPESLKGKSLEYKNNYVENMKNTRDTAQKKMDELMVKRNKYIKEKMASETDKSENSFSNKVYESMKKQSAKKGMVLKSKVKE